MELRFKKIKLNKMNGSYFQEFTNDSVFMITISINLIDPSKFSP